MTKIEKLQRIRAKCVELLAEKTPWHPVCQAGWKSTIAAIDRALECESWDSMIKQMHIRQDADEILDAIIASWQEELL